MLRTQIKFLILGSLMLTVGARNKDVCQSQRCARSAEMFLENMDPTFLPCHNFYDFMCNNFKKVHKLEPGRGRTSAFSLREQYVNQKILEFLNDSDFDNLSSARKAKTIFRNCMDEAKIDQMGEATIPMELNIVGLPIKPPFNAALENRYDFSRLLAKVHRHSVFTKFLFDVSMGPYENDPTINFLHFDNTPSIHQFRIDENPKEPEIFAFRSHFDDDEKIEAKMKARTILKETMKKVVHQMNVLTHAPISKTTDSLIEKRIVEVVDFLVKLNKTKDMEDPALEKRYGLQTKTTIAELQEKTDEILDGNNAQIKINWLDYVETLFDGIRDDAREMFENGEPIIIKNMKQLEETLRVVSQVNRNVFICALWWSVTQSVSPLATAEIRKLYYDHYFQFIQQEFLPSRQSRCLKITKSEFPYVFAFVLVIADDESINDQEKIQKMIINLRNAFEDTITKSAWLDSSTKMAALNKLKFITEIISYEGWMLNPLAIELSYYDMMVVPDHFYGTLKLLKQVRRDKNLLHLGKENNKSKITPAGDPADVNAAYSPHFNNIDIPIGILGPPIYSLGLEALNYGAIGIIMAHELGHAFDNLGKGYDTWGQKRDWWKKRTDREYNKRVECFEKSYSEIMIPQVGKTVNGKLTLGENIADYIGFTQALKAYRKYVEENDEEDLLPNFEHYSHDKLFTMAFANLYCEMTSTGYVKNQLENDEHSPGRARVLGVLKNSPEFAKIWRCPDDAEMNPKEKCHLW